jgi:hypothetical protein
MDTSVLATYLSPPAAADRTVVLNPLIQATAAWPSFGIMQNNMSTGSYTIVSPTGASADMTHTTCKVKRIHWKGFVTCQTRAAGLAISAGMLRISVVMDMQPSGPPPEWFNGASSSNINVFASRALVAPLYQGGDGRQPVRFRLLHDRLVARASIDYMTPFDIVCDLNRVYQLSPGIAPGIGATPNWEVYLLVAASPELLDGSTNQITLESHQRIEFTDRD